VSPSLDIDSVSASIILKPYDQIYVRKNPTFELQQLVQINGLIKYPVLTHDLVIRTFIILYRKSRGIKRMQIWVELSCTGKKLSISGKMLPKMHLL